MHQVQTALSADSPSEFQAEREPPLPLRGDTILGVCEAIGRDFGFNPLWLRVAFCSALYFSPAVVIGTYFGLGILVVLSRVLFPAPPAIAVPAAESAGIASQPVQAETASPELEAVPIAA